MQSLSFLSFVLCATAVASTWNVSDVQANDWKSIATSVSGYPIWAVTNAYPSGYKALWRSTDYGKSFQNIDILPNRSQYSGERWIGVVASNTGVFYALQYGNGLYYAPITNAYDGSMWYFREVDPTMKNHLPQWAALACSSTGVEVTVALMEGDIYTSRDYGATFYKGKGLSANTVDKRWNAMAMSATGNLVVATSVDWRWGNSIVYFSNDYGVNFEVSKAAPSMLQWTSLTFPKNYDTHWLYATAAPSVEFKTSGAIYRTSDMVTWDLVKNTDKPYNWKSVVSDGYGQTFVAVVNGTESTTEGTVFYSNDSGDSAKPSTTAPSNEQWTAVTAAPDHTQNYGFKYVFACTGGENGKIYYTSDYK